MIKYARILSQSLSVYIGCGSWSDHIELVMLIQRLVDRRLCSSASWRWLQVSSTAIGHWLQRHLAIGICAVTRRPTRDGRKRWNASGRELIIRSVDALQHEPRDNGPSACSSWTCNSVRYEREAKCINYNWSISGELNFRGLAKL